MRDDSIDDGTARRPPRWMEESDDFIVRSLAIAIRQIDPNARDTLAAEVLAHLRFHSEYRTPPTAYEFELPNGGLLHAYDHVLGSRRRLGFVTRQGAEGALVPTAAWVWPRRLETTGAWFSWPMSDRQQRRVLRGVARSVSVAFNNRSTVRVEGALILDPRSQPRRIPN